MHIKKTYTHPKLTEGENDFKKTSAVFAEVCAVPSAVLLCHAYIRVYAILEQMSEVIGFELKPTPDTSLSQMIEYGLSKHLDR